MKQTIVFKLQQNVRKRRFNVLGILANADVGVISSISSIAWEWEDKIVVVGDDVNLENLHEILETKFESAIIEEVKVIREPMTQKIVFKVQQSDKKYWSKALGILADADGLISSIAKQGDDKIVVVGDDVNPAKLNDILKKKFDSAKIEEVIKGDTENLRKKYEDLKKKYKDMKNNAENWRKKYEEVKKEGKK